MKKKCSFCRKKINNLKKLFPVRHFIAFTAQKAEKKHFRKYQKNCFYRKLLSGGTIRFRLQTTDLTECYEQAGRQPDIFQKTSVFLTAYNRIHVPYTYILFLFLSEKNNEDLCLIQDFPIQEKPPGQKKLVFRFQLPRIEVRP